MPPALSSGSKLGPYEIVAPLGEGGMGEVWQARDPRLNRTVAIKVSKSAFNERFEREALGPRSELLPQPLQLEEI